MDSQAIEKLLAGLKVRGAEYTELRQATKSMRVSLPEGMASVIGSRTRKSVPILRVAVQAIANKLFVKQVQAEKATVTKTVKGWLTANKWERLERKLYEAASRDGDTYLLVTWDNGSPKLTLREAFDGSVGAAIVVEPDTDTPTYGINVWKRGKGRCLDIYYPGHIEKYISKGGSTDWEKRQDVVDEAWPLEWTDLNGLPLGIALIRIGDGESDIADAVQVQRDLNEGLLDLTAVSRSQGWPQRYMAGDTGGQFLTNANGQPLRNLAGVPIRREVKLEPGSVMQLQGEKATLGQLDAAKVDRTLVDIYLELMSLLTTVPTHYFKGEWPSGVALIQSEARLDTRVEDHQGVFSPAIIETIRMMLRLAATFGGMQVDPQQDIQIEWHAPQVETEDLVREREKATIELWKAKLISLRTALQRLHPTWTEEQLDAEEAAIKGVSPVVEPTS